MFRKTCPIELQRPALKFNGGAQASLRVVIGSCQSCQGANNVQPRFENKAPWGKTFCQSCAAMPIKTKFHIIDSSTPAYPSTESKGQLSTFHGPVKSGSCGFGSCVVLYLSLFIPPFRSRRNPRRKRWPESLGW